MRDEGPPRDFDLSIILPCLNEAETLGACIDEAQSALAEAGIIGEIIVAGEHLEKMSGGQLTKWRARHIGFVFQFYNLMPMLSAAANVELPLLLTNLSRAERKKHVEVALDMVGLSERAAHKPGELSGGQQQRVGIARAIVTDPSILLCDEPTGDLDRQSADDILHLLQQLGRQQKKTIVMVTHDQKAADYASRTLHVDKGALIEAGVPA